MTRNHYLYIPLFLILSFILVDTNVALAKEMSFKLLADVNTGQRNTALRPQFAETFSGSLYFTATSEDKGVELWMKEAGANPGVLIDINPGTESAWPKYLDVVEDDLYFTAINEDSIRKLWSINRQKELRIVDIATEDGVPLHVVNYLVWEQGIYVLGNQTGVTNAPLTLWLYNEADGLSPLDTNIPSNVQSAEISNLFAFQGDLYLFLYSDPELEHCMLRHYPAPFKQKPASDIPCEALSYDHQVQEYNGLVYITGKSHLLMFDGVLPPEPAFDGAAPIGDLLSMGDALYIATKKVGSGFNGGETLPYVYRIDSSGKTMLTTPSNPSDEHAVIDIAMSSNQNTLYLAETSARWDGESWLANHTMIYTYMPNEGTFNTIAEVSGYDEAIEGVDFLFVNEEDICLGRKLVSLHCMNESGSIEAQTTYTPIDSSPHELTVAGDQLFFIANQDQLNGLMKLNSDSQPDLLLQQSFQKLTEWKSQLFMQKGNNQIFKVSGESDVTLLNDSLTSFPEGIVSVTYGAENIYILSRIPDGDFQTWEFDGQNSPQLLFSLDPNDGFPNIVAFGTELYVYTSPWLFFEPLGRCGVSSYTDGELQPLAFIELDNIAQCTSQVFNTQNNAFVYLEYTATDGSLKSSIGVIDQNNISWFWQSEAIEIGFSDTLVYYQDELFFCGKASSLNNPFFDLLKFTNFGNLEKIGNQCLQKVVMSSVNGEPKLYVTTSGHLTGLHQLTSDGINKVQGVNANSVGIVTDMVQFGNELVLSAKFSDENASYGHELIKVSIINNEVQFEASDSVTIVADGSPNSISLRQSLAAKDIDEGDTIRWSQKVMPEQGTLTGLPLEMRSTGEILFPEDISYTPPQNFSGEDVFQIAISDGYSEAVLAVTISIAATPPAIEPPQKTSGGNLYFIPLLSLLILIQRRRQTS